MAMLHTGAQPWPPPSPQQGVDLGELVGHWVSREVAQAWDARELARRTEGAGRDAADLKGPFLSPVFLTEQSVAVPQILQELRQRAQRSTRLKVLSSIRRLAAAVDNHLLLWDYETGQDRVRYEAQAAIMDVAIVPAHHDVWAEHVSHVLVVSTLHHVELAAVTAPRPFRNVTVQGSAREVHIVAQPAVMLKSAVHSAHGRVFLGATDGCTYELLMHRSDGLWHPRYELSNMTLPLGDRIPGLGAAQYWVRDQLVSTFRSYSGIMDMQVDNERSLLYTLNSRGKIDVWQLGEDGARRYVCGLSETKAVSLHVVQKQEEVQRDGVVLIALKADGQRQAFRGTFVPHGERMQSIAPAREHQAGIAGMPLKNAWAAVSDPPGVRAAVLDLVCIEPPVAPDGVTAELNGRTVRSYVSPSCCLIVPSPCSPQAPQLVGMSSVGTDGCFNVACLVDLQHVWRSEQSRFMCGRAPATGMEIEVVEEQPWEGDSCGLLLPQHDLMSQILRPTPRFLVVHNLGVTSVMRLRPLELVHAALLQIQGHHSLAPHRPAAEFDLQWLKRAFGAPELGVMLLTIIAQGNRAAGRRPGSNSARAAEARLAATLGAPPTREVVERARQEFWLLLTEGDSSGHLAFFTFFARCVKPLWKLGTGDPAITRLVECGDIFSLPLEELQTFLAVTERHDAALSAELVARGRWDRATDTLSFGPPDQESPAGCDPLQQCLQAPSCADALQMCSGAPVEAAKVMQHLCAVKLRETVECTVQALKLLRSLKLLPAAARERIAQTQNRPFHRLILQRLDRLDFTTALMAELLGTPDCGDALWAQWSRLRCFFDPASVSAFEVRRQIVFDGRGRAPSRLGDALHGLQDPNVARSLLGLRIDQRGRAMKDPADDWSRVKVICDDLREALRFKEALKLAVCVARSCDEGDVAVQWHAYQAFGDHAGVFGAAVQGRDCEGDTLFRARMQATLEVGRTLQQICDEPSAMALDIDPREQAAKADAVSWAFGEEAGRYFAQSPDRRARRPALSGNLFGADLLLHFTVFHWLAQRPDAHDQWPTRQDLAFVRCAPHADQATTDGALRQWLAAGRWEQLMQNPTVHDIGPLRPDVWRSFWPGWHVGLLRELARACSARGQHREACYVRLGLAHASAALLEESPDVAAADMTDCSILRFRKEQLAEAAKCASMDRSPAGAALSHHLEQAQYELRADVQLELLRALPTVSARTPEEEAWLRRDRLQLRNELLGFEALQASVLALASECDQVQRQLQQRMARPASRAW